MKKDNDILTAHQELKKMPYSTPEGYFEGMEERMARKIRKEELTRQTPFRLKLVPYLSAAAMLAIIVGLGINISKNRAYEADFQEFAEAMQYYAPLTEPEAIYNPDITEDEALSEEDIINYLIYNGTELLALANE